MDERSLHIQVHLYYIVQHFQILKQYIIFQLILQCHGISQAYCYTGGRGRGFCHIILRPGGSGQQDVDLNARAGYCGQSDR